MRLNKPVRASTPLFCALVLSLALSPTFGTDYAKKKTTFDDVVREAKKLSERSYRAPKPRLPDQFLNLDYDGYRKIIWNPEKSLWSEDDLNFRLEMFHPGYLFKTPVEINEFTDSHIQAIPFTSEFFEYGDLELNPRRISRRAHYAGFRLLFPLNEGDKFDEVMSFLGASYFRALGEGHRYGKSARALAIDTGMNKAEEFPIFREFWIGKPDFESIEVRIYGLLDSPSVAGAYQFDVRPGKETIIDVKCTLFFRNAVEWLGLAPLTSMYWYGENATARPQDFRPEVHDSDGLLTQVNDEWTWRALANDGNKRTHVVSGEGLQGFGLMQRDRTFSNFQDLEAYYHARPSVWIEPLEHWTPGTVQLIEFPTNNEYFDNVVAAWVPDEQPEKGSSLTASYRLRWMEAFPSRSTLARVVSTRVGNDPEGRGGNRFVVEFAQAGEQKTWSAEKLRVETSTTGTLEITDIKVLANPFNQQWRVTFLVNGEEAGDVACRLLLDEVPVSETWSHPWKPNL